MTRLLDSELPGGEAMVVTADSVDPHLDKPYIDVRDERDTPVPHLLVHGGFEGTDARFEVAFPPTDRFQGRFYQATHQLYFDEHIDPVDIGMAADQGAFFVRTNMGGSEYPKGAANSMSGHFDHSVGGYRVNAAAAKYARALAEELYGPGRIYGFLYGGSGGAYQTITAAEVTHGVWDGFLPFVMGTPNAIPNVFLVRVHAMRLLKDKWPAVLDALEPGGSDDPYEGLDDEQREALEEATRYGFPPRAWFNYLPMGSGPLPLVAGYVPVMDESYFDDFWSKPGYLGTDERSSIRDHRIQHDATVEEILDGPPKRFRLSSVPDADLTGAELVVTSGPAAGKRVSLGEVDGNTVSTGIVLRIMTIPADPEVVDKICVGDSVRIDNSRYLALQTYHRHQVPEPGSFLDHPVYDFLREPDGSPKYPQRRPLIGPQGAFNATGKINTGAFTGKMILMETLLDGDAVPWQADWFVKKVAALLGDELDDRFRIWFIDNALHIPPIDQEAETHAVTYRGVLEQGLRDLSAWVEEGVAPPPSTSYEVIDGQVHVPASARARKGIQPVVDLKVNGQTRADIRAGETVTLEATVEVPPGTGSVVSAHWDFLGTGDYATPGELAGDGTMTVQATFTYRESGTFFPAIRVASQRDGDPDTPYARILNLGRARVVVS